MTTIQTVEIEGTEAFFTSMEVYELTGTEKINQPFEYVVSVVYQSTTEIPIADLLDAEVTIKFKTDATVERQVHGMIANVRDRANSNASYILYDLTVVPVIWDLSRTQPTEIFLNKTVKEMIDIKLTAHQLNASHYSLTDVGGTYASREFVLQYRESDLDFVMRQCEHYGIRFYFDHSGTKGKVVFTDGGFPGIDTVGNELTFQPSGQTTGVYEVIIEHQAVSLNVICKDYNYRTPEDIVAQAQIDSNGYGGVVDYGSHFDEQAEADRIASVRAGEASVQRKQYRCKTDFQQVTAGRTFTLINHHRTVPNLLITEASYVAKQPATGLAITAADQKFEVSFTAIDSSVNYRPPRVTPKPRIDGVLPAIVQLDVATDPPTNITTLPSIDGQGRYQLKFKFDDRLEPDGTLRAGSHQIRMFQPLSGINYGFHFPLRKGVEVMVAFEDGDPDRPVILGAGYNPVLNDPVTTTNQNLSRIKTESGILIEFDDGAGGGTGTV